MVSESNHEFMNYDHRIFDIEDPILITYDPRLFESPSIEDVRLITDLQIKIPDITPVNATLVLKNLHLATDKRRKLSYRVSSFLVGGSHLSRGIGILLDGITIFLPFGRKIDNGRDALRLILQRKTKRDDNMDKVKGWIKQPSTKAGIVVLTSVLTYWGLDVNPEILQDTLASIAQGAALVVAGAVALYEMFRKEKD